eukprot:1993750-Rhodomonas_salina.2
MLYLLTRSLCDPRYYPSARRTCLRASYAMSCTDLAYAAPSTSLLSCYATPPRTLLSTRYHRPTPSPVLT